MKNDLSLVYCKTFYKTGTASFFPLYILTLAWSFTSVNIFIMLLWSQLVSQSQRVSSLLQFSNVPQSEMNDKAECALERIELGFNRRLPLRPANQDTNGCLWCSIHLNILEDGMFWCYQYCVVFYLLETANILVYFCLCTTILLLKMCSVCLPTDHSFLLNSK